MLSDITKRQQTEVALRHSEMWFNQLVQQSGTVVWQVDAQGLYTYVSHAAGDVWGYRPEELVGRMHFYDLHPADGREAFKAAALAAFAQKNPFKDLEKAVQTKNGAVKSVITNGLPLLNRDGNLLAYHGADLDITESRQAKKVLLERREHYRREFDNAIVASCIFDAETLEFVAVNDAAVWLYGYSREDLLAGMKATDLSAEPEATTAFIDRAIESARNSFAVPLHDHRSKNRAVFSVATVGEKYMRDDRLVFLVMIMDVSGRNQEHEKLRQVSERLTMATQARGVGSWDWDIRTSQLTWDDQMFQLYGVAEHQSIGTYMTWRTGLHPDDALRNGAEIQMALRGDKAFDTQFRVLWADGSVRHLRAVAAVTRDASGQPVRMTGNSWDITDQRQYEVELIRAKHRAGSAHIAKADFLANRSSKVRTPMNGDIGTNKLPLDTQLHESQRPGAETVGASGGEPLLGLISDLLDFSKTGADKLDLETLEFDLSRLLDDVTPTLALRATEKGLKFAGTIDLDVPVLLRGTPGRLRRILASLAGNSIKHTHQGEVAIRVSLLEQQANEVLLLFAVRDTGIGIPTDTIHRLFGTFCQVDAASTRKHGNTGLSLTISKQQGRLLDGEVGIESQEGQGSEIWFTARLGQ